MATNAQKFARLLRTAGWSQADAARRLSVTPGAVSQICSGRTQPRPATLTLLQLILAREQVSSAGRGGRRAATGWEREILEGLRRLTPSQRERLLPVLRQMIKAIRAG